VCGVLLSEKKSNVDRVFVKRNAVLAKSSHIWIDPFEVHDLVPHDDQRGRLFEILRFKDHVIPSGGQLYTSSIEPYQQRGDHYHLKKRQWFTCVSGEVIMLLTTETGENAVIHLSPDSPKIVYVGTKVTIALLNEKEKPAVVVVYVSEQLDHNDPDTYPRTAYPGYSRMRRKHGQGE